MAAINRFSTPQKSQYVSQFVPTILPLDLMKKQLENADLRVDKQLAAIDAVQGASGDFQRNIENKYDNAQFGFSGMRKNDKGEYVNQHNDSRLYNQQDIRVDFGRNLNALNNELAIVRAQAHEAVSKGYPNAKYLVNKLYKYKAAVAQEKAKAERQVGILDEYTKNLRDNEFVANNPELAADIYSDIQAASQGADLLEGASISNYKDKSEYIAEDMASLGYMKTGKGGYQHIDGGIAKSKEQYKSNVANLNKLVDQLEEGSHAYNEVINNKVTSYISRMDQSQVNQIFDNYNLDKLADPSGKKSFDDSEKRSVVAFAMADDMKRSYIKTLMSKADIEDIYDLNFDSGYSSASGYENPKKHDYMVVDEINKNQGSEVGDMLGVNIYSEDGNLKGEYAYATDVWKATTDEIKRLKSIPLEQRSSDEKLKLERLRNEKERLDGVIDNVYNFDDNQTVRSLNAFVESYGNTEEFMFIKDLLNNHYYSKSKGKFDGKRIINDISDIGLGKGITQVADSSIDLNEKISSSKYKNITPESVMKVAKDFETYLGGSFNKTAPAMVEYVFDKKNIVKNLNLNNINEVVRNNSKGNNKVAARDYYDLSKSNYKDIAFRLNTDNKVQENKISTALSNQSGTNRVSYTNPDGERKSVTYSEIGSPDYSTLKKLGVTDYKYSDGKIYFTVPSTSLDKDLGEEEDGYDKKTKTFVRFLNNSNTGKDVNTGGNLEFSIDLNETQKKNFDDDIIAEKSYLEGLSKDQLTQNAATNEKIAIDDYYRSYLSNEGEIDFQHQMYRVKNGNDYTFYIEDPNKTDGSDTDVTIRKRDNGLYSILHNNSPVRFDNTSEKQKSILSERELSLLKVMYSGTKADFTKELQFKSPEEALLYAYGSNGVPTQKAKQVEEMMEDRVSLLQTAINNGKNSDGTYFDGVNYYTIEQMKELSAIYNRIAQAAIDVDATDFETSKERAEIDNYNKNRSDYLNIGY